jgi:hypothetical protein
MVATAKWALPAFLARRVLLVCRVLKVYQVTMVPMATKERLGLPGQIQRFPAPRVPKATMVMTGTTAR